MGLTKRPTRLVCGACRAVVVDMSVAKCACGSLERVEVMDAVDAGEQMGRIVGGAVAEVFAPGNGLSNVLMGGLGAFIGRRVGRGHPLISVGYAAQRPSAEKARVKRNVSTAITKPKKKRQRKKKEPTDDKP